MVHITKDLVYNNTKGGFFMEELMNIASYINNRYECLYGAKIDEMKLHKLLYFSQREALIQNNEPLFDATFYGWKFGPILKEIRNAYRDNSFIEKIPDEVLERIEPIMNKIFEEYAPKDSWSLSRLTHGEISWKNSRIGVPESENSDNPIKIEDITKDAERIRRRREMRTYLGLN